MVQVLVAVDFSDATERVLRAVTGLATGATGAELSARLVHIAASEPELAGYDKESFEANTPDKRAAALRDEHQRLDELTTALAEAGVTALEPIMAMGHTVDELVRLAGELDAGMVVVGSHGHGGLHHLLVGSTTEALLRRSPVPVLVVPAHLG